MALMPTLWAVREEQVHPLVRLAATEDDGTIVSCTGCAEASRQEKDVFMVGGFDI